MTCHNFHMPMTCLQEIQKCCRKALGKFLDLIENNTRCGICFVRKCSLLTVKVSTSSTTIFSHAAKICFFFSAYFRFQGEPEAKICCLRHDVIKLTFVNVERSIWCQSVGFHCSVKFTCVWMYTGPGFAWRRDVWTICVNVKSWALFTFLRLLTRLHIASYIFAYVFLRKETHLREKYKGGNTVRFGRF